MGKVKYYAMGKLKCYAMGKLKYFIKCKIQGCVMWPLVYVNELFPDGSEYEHEI
jgi:hypothetical protein